LHVANEGVLRLGIAADDPLLAHFVLPKAVAAHLAADGRFAAIMFQLDMAYVAAERYELTKEAFETALMMGLDELKRRDAEEWLEKYARGGVPRRRN
jgi:hypothetical protein